MLEDLRRWIVDRMSVADPPVNARVHYSGRTQAGVYIDPDRALQNATVWACCRYLQSAVSHLSWRVMRETRRGAERVPNHPVDWILNNRPNPEMSSFTFREALMGDALLAGNGYAEIERDQVGRLVALHYIHHSRVEPLRRPEDGTLFYRVHNGTGGVPTDLDALDTFHLRGYGAGPLGFSVVRYAAQSIGWAQATELFGSSFFGEGMNPAGIVETQKGLSVAGQAALRADLETLYKGPRKSNRTAILDAGMKWTRLSTAPNEAQFIETMQHQVEEICRWFGVPPHKVMHLLRATFSNIEHQSIEVVVDSVTPWASRLEEEANYKLFGQNRPGFFTKINLNGLLRGDSVSRAAFYKTMREMGVMSANDILQLEDMNMIGPEGDKRIVAMNMTTLERIGEDPAPAAPPKAPGDPASTPTGDSQGDGTDTPADQPGDGTVTTAMGRKLNGHRVPHQ